MLDFTSRKFLRSYLTGLVLLVSSIIASAQVNVTPATPSSAACIGGAAVSISNIVVSETVSTDFGNAVSGPVSFTINLTNGTDFQFVPGVGNINFFPGSGDISSPSIVVSASTISVSFTANTFSFMDAFVISGIQVKAVSGTSPTADLSLATLSVNSGSDDIVGFAGSIFATVTGVGAPTVNAGLDVQSCFASPVIFAGATATNGTTQWITTNGTGSLANANTLTPTYTPGVGETGNIHFTLTVTGSGNCGSIQDTKIVQILPQLIADAGATQFICNGASVTIGGSPTAVGGSGVYTYAWTNTVSVSSNPIVSPTSTTTYNLTVTDNATCVDNTKSVIVNVNPIPVAPSIVSPSGPVNQCQGVGSVTLTSSASAGAYQWYKNGAKIIGEVAATLVLSEVPASNGSYTVTILDGSPTFCESAQSAPLTVTFNPLPLSTPTVLPSAVEVCSGGTVTITVSGSQSGVNYQVFDGGGSPVSGPVAGTGGSIPLITGAMTSSGSLSVKAFYSSTGCTITLAGGTTLTVNPIPTANPGGPYSVCSGLTTTLTGSGSGGTGSYTYSWSPAVGLSAANIFNPVFNGLATTTYSLTVTDSKSCTSAVNTATVTVNPNPVANAGADKSVCYGLTTTLSGSATGGDGTYSYSWAPAAGLNVTNIANPIFDGLASNIYTLTVTDGNGCVSSDVMNAIVNLPPVANTGVSQDICLGSSITLGGSPTATGGDGTYSYLWTGGSVASNPIVSPVITTVYNLSVTDGKGCVDNTQSITITVTPPVVVDAGSNAEVCQTVGVQPYVFSGRGTPATASNNDGVYSWAASGGGSFVDNTLLNPTFNITAGFSGPITFTLTANGNGSCAPGVDNFTLNVTPAVVVDAGSNAEVCQTVGLQPYAFSSRVTPASASSNNGVYSWAASGGGSFVDNTVLNPVFNITAGFSGSITFTLTANGNGSCSPGTDGFILDVTPAVVVDAGSNAEVCQTVGVQPYVFSGRGTPATASNNNGVYSWAASGGGSFVDNTLLNPTFNITAGFSGPITFTLTANGNGSCAPGVDNFTLNVTPAVVVDAGSNAEVCQSGSLQLYTFSGRGTPATASSNNGIYSWAASGGGSFVDNTVLNPVFNITAGFSGSITFTLTANGNGSCSPGTDGFTLDVTPAVVVDAGSNAEVCQTVGVQPYVFSGRGTPATASNNDGVYSWAASGGGSFVDNTLLNPTFNITAGFSGPITFTLTANGNGSCAPGVDNFTLNVTPAVVVDAGSNAEVCQTVGLQPYAFSSRVTPASASSNNGVYSWAASGGGSFVDNTVLNPVFNITAGFSGSITFTLTANGNGSCSPGTDGFILDVTPAVVVDAGSNAEVCQTVGVQPYVFSGRGTPATASNNNGVYSWAASGGGSFVDNTLLNPTFNITANFSGPITFTLTANGNGSCAPGVDNFTLNVTPAVVVDAGSNAEVCQSGSLQLYTFSGRGTPATASSNNGIYSWAASGGGSFVDNTVLNPVFNITAGFSGSITFTLTANGNGSCAPGTDGFTLDVTPAVVVDAGSNAVACQNPAVQNFDFSTRGTVASASNNNGVYSWAASGGGSFVDNTLLNPVFNITANFSGPITFTLTANGNGSCAPVADSFTLTVNPTPVITLLQSKTICSGSNVDYKVTLTPGGFPGGTTYTWLAPTMSSGAAQGTPGTAVPESNSLTLTDNLVNLTGAPITALYKITPTNGLCVGVQTNVLITINPAPVIATGQTQLICSGFPVNYHVNLLPSGLPTGTAYSWPAPTMSGGGPQGTPGVGVLESSAFTITDVLVNLTGSPITATYKITPTSGICSGVQTNVIVTINPSPVVASGQSKTICSGDNVNYHVNLLPAGFPVGTTYSWPIPTMSSGPAQGTAGSGVAESLAQTITETLTNITGSPITATYVITATNGTCIGVPVNVVITVNPSPVITAGQNKTICSGDNVNYHVTLTPGGFPGGTTYTWLAPTMSSGAAQGTPGTAVPESNSLTLTDNLVNLTGAPITALYKITPTNGLCVGVQTNVLITINPAPVIATGQTQLICSGFPVNYHVNLLPSGLPTGTAYSWPAPTMSGGGPQGTPGVGVLESSAFTITDVLVNLTGSPITATYKITPTSGICSGVQTNVIVTINPSPVVASGQSKTICSGDNVNYHVNLLPAGFPVGTTYSWPIPTMSSGPAQGTAGSGVAESLAQTITETLTNITGSPITATYVITPTNGTCIGVPVNVVITVNPSPVITAGQSKTICSGDNVNYHVTLTPGGFPGGTTYTWLAPTMSSGAAQGTPGTAVPESNSLTLTDNLVNLTGAPITALYKITPTNGLCVGVQTNVLITINPAPVIATGQTQLICSGFPVNYHVNLLPSGLPTGTAYSWPAPTMSGGGPQGTPGVGVLESSAFTITDVLVNLTGSPITATYKITPTSGICSGVQTNVIVTINPSPVVASGQSKTICSGDNVNYHVNLLPAGFPVGTTYSWPIPTMSSGPAQGTAGSGVAESLAQTITETLTNITGSPITATYVITATNGTCIGVPVNVVITVNPSPVITAGQNKTICSGDNVNYHVTLTPGGFPGGTTYTWLAPTMSSGAAQGTPGTAVPESNSLTLTDNLVNLTGAPITALYKITPTNGLCVGVQTNVLITINPAPVIATGQTQLICSGFPVNYHVNLLPSGLPTGTAYSWPAPTMSGGGPQGTPGVGVLESSAFTITDVLVNLTGSPITATYKITPTSGICSGVQTNVIVTINPSPVVASGQSKTICSGDNVNYHVNLLPAGFPVGTTYSWPIPTMSSGPAQGTAGSGVAESLAQTITETLTNITGSPITATYVITATNGTCIGVPVNVVITVNPSPVITAGQSKTICSGDNVNYHVTLTPGGFPGGTTYTWLAPTMSSGAAQGTPGTAVPESNSLTLTDNLVNLTGAPITALYKITPTNGLCVGVQTNVLITINPAPVIATGQTQLICSGFPVNYHVNLLPSGLPTGTAYSWPAPTMSGGGPQGTPGVGVLESSAFTITDVLVNLTGSPITATYKITPTSGICSGVQTNVIVTINPSPVVASGQSKTICSGDNVNYHVNLLPAGFPVGTTYSWPIPTMSSGPAQGTAGSGVAESLAQTITETLTNITGSPITATYVITATNGTCIGVPVNVVITVNPSPVITAGQSKTICSGDNVNYHVTLTPGGFPGGTTYTWLAPTMSSGAAQGTPGTAVPESNSLTLTDNLVNLTGAPITALYKITPTNGLCVGVQTNVLITINPAPVIATGQTQLICSGFPVNYHVNLLPSGLPTGTAYSWPAPTMSGGGPQGTPGVGVLESSAFTITDVLVNLTGSPITATYKITPTSGICSGVQTNVIVTINPSPVVASGQSKTICSGDNVNYHVNLLPAGFPVGTTYSWPIPTMSSGPAQGTAGSGVAESLAQTITETLTNITGSPITATYVITATNGTCIGVPVNVVITVNPSPVITAGQSKTICSGDNVNYHVTLTPGGFPGGTTYTWLAPTMSSGAAQGTPGTAVPESNSLTLTDNLVNLTGAPITALYKITPTNGLCVGVQTNVLITINPAPVIATGQTQLICSGFPVNYHVNLLPSGLPTGTAYSWPAPTMSGGGPQGTPGVGVLESSAFTITDVLVNLTGSPITATYKITPTSGICSGVQTNVIVTINPSPVVASGQSKTICSGDNVNYHVNLLPAGFPVGTTYSWPIPTMSSGPAQGTAGSGVAESLAQTITETLTNITGSPITATYVITATNGTCIGVPVNVVITVNPSPVITAGQSKTICSGDNVNYHVTLTPGGFPGGTTYTWLAPTMSSGAAQGTPGTAVPESNSLTLTDNLVNLTGAPITALYKITPTNGLCVGVQTNVLITINPAPVIATGQTQLICSGFPVNYHVNLLPSGLPTGTAYSWPAPTMSGGGPQGTPGVGVLESSAFTITDVLVNLTGSPITATYKITPTSGICSGVQTNVIVTINPSPVVASGQSKTICSGDNVNYHVNLLPAGFPVGTTYSWPIPTMSSGPAQGTAGSGVAESLAQTITETLTNITGSPITATYVITATNGTCIGVPVNVVITVNPSPVITAGQNKTICSDVHVDYRVTLTPGGFPAGTKFSWPLPTMSAGGPQGTAGSFVPESNVLTITDLLLNTTGVPITATYKITPRSSNGCDGAQVDVVITINPEPVGTTSSKTICSDLTVGYDLQVNVNATNVLPSNFSWIALPAAGVNGMSLLTRTGSMIDDILFNTTNSPVVVQYNIIPSSQSTGCTGNQFSIFVTVNPRAKISAGPDLAQCEDVSSITLQGSINYAPNGVTWSGGAGGFSAITSPTSDYSFVPSEVNTSILLTLTATDPDGGGGPCMAVTSTMHVRVNKLPVVFYSGLPLTMVENNAPVTLSGNQVGGIFTILPVTSNIGSTVPSPVDKAPFDPSAVTLGLNTVTYTYIDGNGCKNTSVQNVTVNPVTNIDFFLQIPGSPPINVAPNPLGQFEVCAQIGQVNLIGNPQNSTGFPPETQFIGVEAYIGGPIVTVQKSGQLYFFDTNGLSAGTYSILYTYKNTFGAITTNQKDVVIFAAPTASIVPPANNCIVSAINLVSSSTIPPVGPLNPSGGVIVGWNWNFGDGNLGSGSSVSHSYTTPSIYNVTLNVTTNQGCKSSAPLALRVGPQPVVNFDWSAICTNDLTKFLDLSNPGISTIDTYTWDFGDATSIISGPPGTPPDGGTINNPFHHYLTTGTYATKLTVHTNDGCTNSLTRNVFILTGGSTVQPTAAVPYKVDFETANGWIPEGLLLAPPAAPGTTSPISWIFGTPSGSTIKSASSGSKAWWTGDNIVNNGQNTYYDLESSVVNGPCFDLTLLKRPMVSLDYWSDAEKNLDGTVVQYSTDGGLHWTIVGPLAGLTGNQRDQGINWYDPNATIVSNPGQQLIGQYGWTDKTGGWKNARFNLDMVDPLDRDQVRVRIAFSSNNKNAAVIDGSGNPITYDGFAFDNVYVGEKQRNVLVEHFTNSSLAASVAGDTWINQRYQEQLTNRGTSDFYDIQYHISYPNTDQLNIDNPSDPAGRSLYFGVAQPPYTIMDGIVDGVKFNGSYTNLDINGVEADRRALKDPLFDLKLTASSTGTDNLITVSLDITAKQAYTTPLIAQVALLENQTGTFKNVLRKQLFGSDGETITLPFTGPPSATTVTKGRTNLAVNVPITNPTKLTLVAYVQDKNTKEILQSVVIPSPKVLGSVVTGIEPVIQPTTLNGIVIYPNPARGSLYFKLPEDQTSDGFEWKLIDQRGVTVKSGNFEDLIDTTKQVDISGLASGIYIVALSGPGGTVVYRKIVVMN